MKKSAFLSLLLLLSVVVTGCAGSAEPPAEGTSTTTITTTADKERPTDPEGPEAPVEDMLPGEIIPPDDDPDFPDDEIYLPDDLGDSILGSFDGNLYSNSYIGIARNFDSNWQVQINQSGAASINPTQFYDMQAQNILNNASTYVVLTRLSDMEQAAYATASSEEVVDIALLNSDAHCESYIQAGMTVQSMSKATFTFLGQNQFGLYTVCDLKGVDYHIVQLFRYDLGAYGATITVAGFSEETVRQILAEYFAI